MLGVPECALEPGEKPTAPGTDSTPTKDATKMLKVESEEKDKKIKERENAIKMLKVESEEKDKKAKELENAIKMLKMRSHGPIGTLEDIRDCGSPLLSDWDSVGSSPPSPRGPASSCDSEKVQQEDARECGSPRLSDGDSLGSSPPSPREPASSCDSEKVQQEASSPVLPEHGSGSWLDRPLIDYIRSPHRNTYLDLDAVTAAELLFRLYPRR